MVRTGYCSCRRPMFSAHDLHLAAYNPTSVIPVPEDLTPSSTIYEHFLTCSYPTHTHTHTHTDTHTHLHTHGYTQTHTDTHTLTHTQTHTQTQT